MFFIKKIRVFCPTATLCLDNDLWALLLDVNIHLLAYIDRKNRNGQSYAYIGYTLQTVNEVYLTSVCMLPFFNNPVTEMEMEPELYWLGRISWWLKENFKLATA